MSSRVGKFVSWCSPRQPDKANIVHRAWKVLKILPGKEKASAPGWQASVTSREQALPPGSTPFLVLWLNYAGWFITGQALPPSPATPFPFLSWLQVSNRKDALSDCERWSLKENWLQVSNRKDAHFHSGAIIAAHINLLTTQLWLTVRDANAQR